MSSISAEIKGVDLKAPVKEFTFHLPRTLYSESVVKKVCYSLGASFKRLDVVEQSWELTILVPESYDSQSLSALEAEINQEAVDYDLREKVFKETETTRNLILANAFANTSISN